MVHAVVLTAQKDKVRDTNEVLQRLTEFSTLLKLVKGVPRLLREGREGRLLRGTAHLGKQMTLKAGEVCKFHEPQ
jgi:hypothetical protein